MFGEFIGKLNLKLFEYLGYIFVLFLFWILYLFYFKKFDFQTSLKTLGFIILFLDFLFLQSVLIHKGVVGNLVVNFLKGYIGILGVGIFIFVVALWGLFLIFEDKIFAFFDFSKKEKNIQNNQVKEEIQKEEKSEENIVNETYPEEVEEEVFPELDEDDINDYSDTIFKKETEILKEDVSSQEDKKENKDENIKTPQTVLKEKTSKEVSEIKEENPEKVKKVSELEDTKKLLSQIEVGEREKPKDWKFPPLDMLQKPPKKKREVNEAEIDKKIKVLLEKLKYFKIEGDVVRYYVGPVVTTFEFKPLPHIKVSKILALQDDLAMALKAQSIRIQAPIPGKDVVGIEIPNETQETIYLREIIESEIFQKSKSPLTMALGKDIVGAPFVTDLKKLPHLLIAGTTGSGKSVGINSMILSLLYKNSPDELKFIMIDPKQLEFSIYNDIPHLLTPVITDSKKAITALNAMVKEMERRYKLMSKMRVKNIEGYNKKVSKEERMPYIIIIIDELADLMMTSGKDVEYAIARLAQMARASGIHLIVATQRPSVDVVTGLIKANLPSRISFKVGQKIDSKVILDQFGAESLLGRGDMLFTPPGIVGLIRLHAPFASEEEIEKIVEFLKSQREAEYDNTILSSIESESEGLEEIENVDELFEEAKEIILKERRTSISYLQRRLQIGYNRAANIIEQMERAGILSPPNAKGQREILI
ncbi:MAG: DNA translocase FtsK [Nautiliaceae bacterium]